MASSLVSRDQKMSGFLLFEVFGNDLGTHAEGPTAFKQSFRISAAQ